MGRFKERGMIMHKNQKEKQDELIIQQSYGDKRFTQQDLDSAISRTIARERKKYEVRAQMKKESTRQRELVEVIEISKEDLEFFHRRIEKQDTIIIGIPKGKNYSAILVRT